MRSDFGVLEVIRLVINSLFLEYRIIVYCEGFLFSVLKVKLYKYEKFYVWFRSSEEKCKLLLIVVFFIEKFFVEGF